MRAKFVVVVVILLVLAVSVSQANNWLGAVSFPLWSERTTQVKAGVSQLVTFSEMAGGQVSAFYKNGFLVIPTDRYGVFADLSIMRVDPLVLGIKLEYIRQIQTRAYDGVAVENGGVVISVGKLQPDLYDVITTVTQNAGRVDERGILPTVLQLIGRKKHHQIIATDTVVGTFGVVDASRYIEMFCKYQLGIEASQMTPEQKYLVKSAYFDSRLKGILEFSEALADYSWLSQGLALKAQGFQPPMSLAAAQPDPAIAAYQQQIAGLQATVQALNEKINSLSQPAAAAPKVVEPAVVPAERFNWRLVLPTGRWGITTSCGGHERTFTGPYSGTVEFRDAAAGQVMIQLTPAGGGQLTTWRSAKLSGPCAINYTDIKEVR